VPVTASSRPAYLAKSFLLCACVPLTRGHVGAVAHAYTERWSTWGHCSRWASWLLSTCTCEGHADVMGQQLCYTTGHGVWLCCSSGHALASYRLPILTVKGPTAGASVAFDRPASGPVAFSRRGAGTVPLSGSDRLAAATGICGAPGGARSGTSSVSGCPASAYD
jgi:hypothetical protein